MKSYFLVVNTQATVIFDDTMHLVDFPFMNCFCLENELFQNAYMHLKFALAKLSPNLGDAKDITSYKLHGFPIAFQI